jgi:6-phosphogluconate dehydrogenase
VTLIGEAVFARCLSSLFDERQIASTVLKGPANVKYQGDKTQFIEAIRQVIYNSFYLLFYILFKKCLIQ